jgi:hypothetical protein
MKRNAKQCYETKFTSKTISTLICKIVIITAEMKFTRSTLGQQTK